MGSLGHATAAGPAGPLRGGNHKTGGAAGGTRAFFQTGASGHDSTTPGSSAVSETGSGGASSSADSSSCSETSAGGCDSNSADSSSCSETGTVSGDSGSGDSGSCIETGAGGRHSSSADSGTSRETRAGGRSSSGTNSASCSETAASGGSSAVSCSRGFARLAQQAIARPNIPVNLAPCFPRQLLPPFGKDARPDNLGTMDRAVRANYMKAVHILHCETDREAEGLGRSPCRSDQVAHHVADVPPRALGRRIPVIRRQRFFSKPSSCSYAAVAISPASVRRVIGSIVAMAVVVVSIFAFPAAVPLTALGESSWSRRAECQ